MTPALTMAEVAAALGMGAETFRKRRSWLVRELGFPAPIDKGVRPLAWRPEAVEAWLGHRRAALGAGHRVPANDGGEGWTDGQANRACRRQAAADRATLQRLMAR